MSAAEEQPEPANPGLEMQERIHAVAKTLREFGAGSVVIVVTLHESRQTHICATREGNYYACHGSLRRYLRDEFEEEGREE